MKLCKDCKHFTTVLHYALCDHPSANHSSIDGSPVSQCEFVRDGLIGKCGPEAKLFEQKPPEEQTKKPSIWDRIERFLAPLGNGGYNSRRP